MTTDNALRDWKTRLRIGLALAAALLCLVAIPVLVQDVRSRLAALERANSDNSQWGMMQTEVEILRLQAAILDVLDTPGEPPLDEVRRWFNVLYSRISMLENSGLYAPLLAAPETQPDHRLLRGFLNDHVALIDGPDDRLRARLDDIAPLLPDLRAAARRMTLNSLSIFAAEADLNRNSMADTLIRLAMATGALVLMLGGTAIILGRQFRRAEAQGEALRQTGGRLSTIFATSADGIVVTDPDGIIRDFNPAAEAIFGLSARDAIGRSAFASLFAEGPQGPQAQSLIDALRAPRGRTVPFRIEIDARHADGRCFPVEVTIARAEVPQSGLVVAFIRDISGRRAADAELTRARDRALASEKAKAEFLAVMSHEMRTPLNGLIGSMELMRQTRLSAQQAELMEVMESSGEILLGHVNAVLDVSRAAAGALRPLQIAFELESLIEDCLSNQAGLAATAGNSLAANCPAGPVGLVLGDRGRLGQILLNLIGNAVKFTRQGTITVEAERLPGPGDRVEIRVTDTGIGIAEADMDRIFDDFVTLDASYGRETGGTGLGLPIARRLAEALGGEIGVESEEGEGSLFWLRLPLPKAIRPEQKAGPAADGPAPAPPSGPPRSILLVEDNAINRLLLRRFLEAGGHKVTEAVDGIEGVAQAEGRAFDLILMDISMPRMDGIAATRAIRDGTGPSRKARIIALTAHALPDEQARFRAAGMDATLAKPIGQQALLRAVAGTLPPAASPENDPHAGRDSADIPILHEDTLADLLRQIGPTTTATLVQRLLDDGDLAMARLSRDPSTAAEDMARACHQLAGTAGTFGTWRLRAALIAAESPLQSGDTAAAARALADLPDIWAETRAALLARIAQVTSAA